MGYTILKVARPRNGDLEIGFRIVTAVFLSLVIYSSLSLILGLLEIPSTWEITVLALAIASSLLLILTRTVFAKERDNVTLYGILGGPEANQARIVKGRERLLLPALVAGLLLVSASLVALLPLGNTAYSEFYLLDSQKEVLTYPSDLHVGQNASVIVGIANHEHRQVHYYYQAYLVNATFVNNVTYVNHMYYFDQHDVVLNHTDVNLAQFTPQYESNYTFSVPIPGDFKLWWFLFEDSVPEYAQNLTHMQDYAGTSTIVLVDQAVDNQILSLNLNLHVTP